MKIKRYMALLFVAVFMIMNVWSVQTVQPKVHAVAPVIVAGAAAVTAAAAYFIISTGMSWNDANVGEYIVNQFLSDPTYYNAIADAVQSGVVKYNPESMKYFMAIPFADALYGLVKGWVDDNFDAGENSFVMQSDDDVYLESGVTYYSCYDGVIPNNYIVANEIVSSVPRVALMTLAYDGNVLKLSRTLNNGASYSYYSLGIYGDKLVRTIIFDEPNHKLIFQNSAYNYSTFSNVYSVYFSGSGSDVIGGATGAEEAVDVEGYNWVNDRTGVREVGIDLFPSIDAGLDRVTDIEGQEYGVNVGQVLSDSVGMTNEDVISQPLTGVNVDNPAMELDEAIEDALTLDEAGEYSESSSSLKALFFSKFPFCIPWDFYNAVKLIAATPEAPHWEIDLMAPLKDRLPFTSDTTIYIDMADYPVVGKVFRWTSLVGFSIGLMFATRKLIWK